MELAALGLVPAGSYRNREYYLPRVVNRAGVLPEIIDILADPQTSGGLLIAVAGDKLARLAGRLEAAGCAAFAVGRVVAEHPGSMVVT
jgi:selenide,water dikinase